MTASSTTASPTTASPTTASPTTASLNHQSSVHSDSIREYKGAHPQGAVAPNTFSKDNQQREALWRYTTLRSTTQDCFTITITLTDLTIVFTW